MPRRLALIVNPIAGLGGAVGLTGTDGDRAERARALGATGVAPVRAVAALRALQGTDVRIETCSGAMGAEAAERAGLSFDVVVAVGPGPTNAADTRRAATMLRDRRPDLLLMVGGDGTARDVLECVGRDVPVLGVPAGVKTSPARPPTAIPSAS
jgi:predicted polyphosphate/ATP-dependent NAD kinase